MAEKHATGESSDRSPDDRPAPLAEQTMKGQTGERGQSPAPIETQVATDSSPLADPEREPEAAGTAASSIGVDWDRVGRLVMRSRVLDELEESELAPSGEVPSLPWVAAGLSLKRG